MNVLRVLALCTVWCVLTRELSFANAVLGLALGVWLVRVAGDRSDRVRTPSVAAVGRRALRKPWIALELAAFFVYELVVSNVRIAVLMLRPRLDLRPMILPIRVDARSDEELAVLSDLVTLTPGTLTLDASDDRSTILVHVLTAESPDDVRRSIGEGLARRVRRLFE